jgi:hypothetical protein
MGSPFKYGTRRLIPKKFKFSLVYVVVGDKYRRPAKVIVANHSLPIGHQVNTSTPTAVANHKKLAQHRPSSIQRHGPLVPDVVVIKPFQKPAPFPTLAVSRLGDDTQWRTHPNWRLLVALMVGPGEKHPVLFQLEPAPGG